MAKLYLDIPAQSAEERTESGSRKTSNIQNSEIVRLVENITEKNTRTQNIVILNAKG